MQLDQNQLIIIPPTISWKRSSPNFTIEKFALKFNNFSFDSILYISLLGNVETNSLSLLVSLEGNSYLYDVLIGKGQTVPVIGSYTQVYVHPSISYMTINFNTQRIDYDYLRRYKDLSFHCISFRGESYCPKCEDGFNLFKPGCKARTGGYGRHRGYYGHHGHGHRRHHGHHYKNYNTYDQDQDQQQQQQQKLTSLFDKIRYDFGN